MERYSDVKVFQREKRIHKNNSRWDSFSPRFKLDHFFPLDCQLRPLSCGLMDKVVLCLRGTLVTFGLSVAKGSSATAAPHVAPILKVNSQLFSAPYSWAYFPRIHTPLEYCWQLPSHSFLTWFSTFILAILWAVLLSAQFSTPGLEIFLKGHHQPFHMPSCLIVSHLLLSLPWIKFSRFFFPQARS